MCVCARGRWGDTVLGWPSRGDHPEIWRRHVYSDYTALLRVTCRSSSWATRENPDEQNANSAPSKKWGGKISVSNFDPPPPERRRPQVTVDYHGTERKTAGEFFKEKGRKIVKQWDEKGKKTSTLVPQRSIFYKAALPFVSAVCFYVFSKIAHSTLWMRAAHSVNNKSSLWEKQCLAREKVWAWIVLLQSCSTKTSQTV